ncbi:Ger(x)C family spore germination protein [Fodinisporobacter ferrooxydans]|uniref:Ger(X)C family spore germination protein n=1 Tax=Fodinisporobacter ferrooxydans TaxID=2901836 RepID=A0ABY4CER8_9BACL|nr:Ger(x)C family spore germination protein [Alicyclobacillaceae bacterium MYW30-H2]
MKRCVSYLLAGVLSFLVAGCWDRTEINDLAFVMATGIDALPNNKIKLCNQFALPTGAGQSQNGNGGKGGKAYFIEDSKGVDVWDSAGFLQEKLSRKIFTAHRRIIVIGETFAKRGIRPFLDEFIRHPQSRMSTYILVAKGTTAEDLLQTSYPFETVPMEAMREILRSKVGLVMDIKDVLGDVLSEQSLVMPAIEKVQRAGSNKQTFRLSGTAIFHHDKLVGYLDDRKTRGLIWLRQKAQRAVITVQIPKLHGTISADVIHASTKIKAKKEHGQIVMYYRANAEDDISENDTPLDLTKPKNIKYLEQFLSKDLEERIRTTLDDIQHRYKSDVAEFGPIVHRTYPQDWKKIKNNWNQDFSKMKVVVQTNVTIRRIGMSGQSLNIPEKKIKKNPPN